MRLRLIGGTSIGTALAVALLIAAPLAVVACSVPVFRFALERWKSDNYKVTVFHRGLLTDDQRKLLTAFAADGDKKAKSFANVQLETVDLDAKPDEETLQRWKDQKTDTLPWMTVDYPREMPPAVAAPLTRENVDRLVDSPVRREIARRILKGGTAVWILLESGNREADDNAFDVLRSEITKSNLDLKLPEIDKQDIEDKLVSVDPSELKISFSAIRVSRDDPAEKFMVEMLLGSEGAGEDGFRSPQFANQPMAFPIFGRGRILYGLVGEGISDEMVGTACKELVGACTCEVKEKNPGIDLLMSVNWDELVQPTIDINKELPPLAGLGAFASDDKAQLASATAAKIGDDTTTADKNDAAGTPERIERELSVIEVSVTTDPEPAGMSSLTKNMLIIAGLAAVAVIAVSCVLVSRKG